MSSRVREPPGLKDDDLVDEEDINNILNFFLDLGTKDDISEYSLQENVYLRKDDFLYPARIVDINEESTIEKPITVDYVFDPIRYFKNRNVFEEQTRDLERKFGLSSVYPSTSGNDTIYCIFVNRLNNYFGFEIKFPSSVKELLEEDEERVKKRKKYKFPISPKVHTLLRDYEEDTLLETKNPFEGELVKQYRATIESYFNSNFHHLLCDFELPQHRKKFPSIDDDARDVQYRKPSFFYGYGHLMRFLLKLPLFLERDRLDESTFRFLSKQSNHLLKYIGEYYQDEDEDDDDD